MAEETVPKQLLQTMPQGLGGVAETPEISHPLICALRCPPNAGRRGKYFPTMPKIELQYVVRWKSCAERKGNDAPGRGASNHVEILTRRNASRYVRFDLGQEGGRKNSTDSSAID